MCSLESGSVVLDVDEVEVIDEPAPAVVLNVVRGVSLAGYVSVPSTIKVNPFPAIRISISRAHLS